jgi:hypothetical protein
VPKRIGSNNINEDFKKIKETYYDVDNLIAFFVVQDGQNLFVKQRYFQKNLQNNTIQNFISF